MLTYSLALLALCCSLARRVFEHKNDLVEGFTKKYNVKMLVYYESMADVGIAIAREKIIKKWNRDWKIKLIEGFNEDWADLYDQIIA